MKRIAVLALATTLLACLFALAGCGSAQPEPVAQPSASTLDGVSVELESVSMEYREKTGSTIFQVETKVTNGSDVDIMQVEYELSCLDAQGTVLDTFTCTYNGGDKALAPGESVIDEKGFQKKLDGEAATMGLELLSVTTAEEMPPVRLPQTGEYLYETLMLGAGMPDITKVKPDAIRFGIDQGGYLREALFDKGEPLDEAITAFSQIKVGDEVDEFVTDNYNYIELEFGGTFYHVNLNLYNLEASAYDNWHIYQLENLEPLWNLAEANAVEVDGSITGGS